MNAKQRRAKFRECKDEVERIRADLIDIRPEITSTLCRGSGGIYDVRHPFHYKQKYFEYYGDTLEVAWVASGIGSKVIVKFETDEQRASREEDEILSCTRKGHDREGGRL